MSWLTDIFGGGDNSAQSQLTKYYNQGTSALNPYATAGNNALSKLMNGASALMNPQALESKWINSYQESPFAKQLSTITAQNGMTDASAMGLEGSAPAVNAITQSTGNIVNQDRQTYLNDLMQKYLSGLNTLKGVYGTGANAAGEIGQLSQNMGENSADLSYNSSNQPGDILAGLLATGAGAFFGGPGGAAVGSALAKHF